MCFIASVTNGLFDIISICEAVGLGIGGALE
jgi:hypothetical protein